MTYKVIRMDVVARDFKTKAKAEEFASYNIQENEDTRWKVEKE